MDRDCVHMGFDGGIGFKRYPVYLPTTPAI